MGRAEAEGFVESLGGGGGGGASYPRQRNRSSNRRSFGTAVQPVTSNSRK